MNLKSKSLLLMLLLMPSCIYVDRTNECIDEKRSGTVNINTVTINKSFVTTVYYEYRVCKCCEPMPPPVYDWAAERAVFMYFHDDKNNPQNSQEMRDGENEIRRNFVKLMPNTSYVKVKIEDKIL